jgi:hypothetical protein
MRRIITGAVIALLLIITAAIGFYYYQRYRVILSDPFNAIPTNSALIFECQSGHAATAELSSTGFWENWTSPSSLGRLRRLLEFADSASQQSPAYRKAWIDQPLYLSLHLAGSTGAGWLGAWNIPAGLSYQEVADEVRTLFPAEQFQEREYEDVTIYETGTGAGLACFAISKGVLLISESPVLLEDAIRQSRNGTPLKKVRLFSQVAKATNRSTIRIYVNSIGIRDLLGSSWNGDHTEVLELASRIGRWSSLQVRIMKDEVRLEGACGSADPSDWISAFQGSQPQRIGLTSVLPDRTTFLLWLGSNHFTSLRDRLRNDATVFPSITFLESQRSALINEFRRDLVTEFDGMTGQEAGLAITEPAGQEFSNNQLVVLRALRPAEAERMLDQWGKIPGGKLRKETYRGKTLMSFPDNRWALLTLGSLSSGWSQCAVTFVQGYFIVGPQSAALKTVLDDLAEGRKLDSKPGFGEHLRRIGNDQHLFAYASASRSHNLLKAFLPGTADAEQGSRLQDVFLAMQVRKDQLFHVQVAFTAGRSPGREPAIVWSAQLDTLLHAGPFLLPGDDAGKFYVAVQDKLGGFYLFNESGNLLWKVLVNDTLTGSVHTVDYYRQGTWQLLFNTANRMFLLDRDGRSVANYPIRLPAAASCGLSVTDAGSGSEPMILVPCTNGSVYHYRLNGSPDPDWNTERPVGVFTQPFLTARVGDERYYISLTNDGKLRTLDAKGKGGILHNVGNPVKMVLIPDDRNGDRIAVLDADGNVELVDMKGNSLPVTDSVKVLDICAYNDTDQTILLTLRTDSLFALDRNGVIRFSAPAPPACDRIYHASSKGRFVLCGDRPLRTWVYRGDRLLSNGFPVSGGIGKGAYQSVDMQGDKLPLTDQDHLIYLYTLE